jgi:Protein of unknown function VcgC/VcgE (DUF2780)
MIACWKRVVGCVVLLFPLLAVAEAPGHASQLVGLLVHHLGVTQEQAAGGAGAILAYARNRLSPDEFSTLSHSLPDVGELIAKAPKLGAGDLAAAPGGGGVGPSAGTEQQMGELEDLARPFARLGMSDEMVDKFVPVILQYLQSVGGADVANLLQSALSE